MLRINIAQGGDLDTVAVHESGEIVSALLAAADDAEHDFFVRAFALRISARGEAEGDAGGSDGGGSDEFSTGERWVHEWRRNRFFRV